jgi:hypothetical protein
MVVRVHVEQDERSTLGNPVEARTESVEERVVRREAALELFVRELSIAPHLEPPAVVRGAIDRVAARPIEVALEPGPMSQHPSGTTAAIRSV